MPVDKTAPLCYNSWRTGGHMIKDTELLIAFAQGDKKEFYKHFDNQKNFYTATRKMPFLCELVSYSDKGLDLSEEERKARRKNQTEIFRELLAKKDEEGQYYYDVNEADNSIVCGGEEGYKVLDLALIKKREDFVYALFEREDLDLRKFKKQTYFRGGFENENPLVMAIKHCPSMVMPIIKKGNFSSKEVIWERGRETASVREMVYCAYKKDDLQDLIKQLDEIDKENF